MTTPYTYVDAGSATVAVDGGRIVGGPSITIEAGKGALFGSPSISAPMALSVYRSSTFVTALQCTGVAGDVLTISGPWDDHADAAIQAGDEIYNGPTKKDMNELWTWVKTPGPAGTDGTNGAPGSVWREGSGAPANTLGINGDYYLDGSTGDVYLKTAGVYAVACNIKGATGATGPAGVGSFGVSMPPGFVVSGSPLTSSGTIAISTPLAGMLKATGTGFTTATAGTDYVDPAGLTSALAGYATLASPSFTGTVAINSLTVHHDGTANSSIITTSATEIVLQENGDTYGTVRLRLQNRNGSNGALFENTGVPLVDFGFSAGGVQRNFRFETRYTQAFSGSKEFQILDPVTPAVNVAFADAQTYLFGGVVFADTTTRGSLINGGGPPLATIDNRGSHRDRTDAVSASTTLTKIQHSIGVNTSAAAVPVALPASTPRGMKFEVFDETGHAAVNNVTVRPPTGGTIDGATSYVIASNYGSVTLRALGSNAFKIIGKV